VERPSDSEIIEEMTKIKARGEGTYKYLKGLGLSEMHIRHFQTQLTMSVQSESISEQLSESSES
jgi:hypothetical protein